MPLVPQTPSIEERLDTLEKIAHPPVDLRPAIRQLVSEAMSDSYKARAERAEAALRLAQPYVENFLAEEGTEEADEALEAMFAVQAVLAPLASHTKEG